MKKRHVKVKELHTFFGEWWVANKYIYIGISIETGDAGILNKINGDFIAIPRTNVLRYS